jgi:hypothetical protein
LSALGGTFFEPTVLTDVTTDMIIIKVTFGPVAPLYGFMTDAAAISVANDTEFGLSYFLQPRHRPHLARRRGARIRRRRHQRGYHLDRDRALRRHEGKQHRPHLADHWGSKYGIAEFLEVNTSAWAASTGNTPRRWTRGVSTNPILQPFFQSHRALYPDDAGGPHGRHRPDRTPHRDLVARIGR